MKYKFGDWQLCVQFLLHYLIYFVFISGIWLHIRNSASVNIVWSWSHERILTWELWWKPTIGIVRISKLRGHSMAHSVCV